MGQPPLCRSRPKWFQVNDLNISYHLLVQDLLQLRVPPLYVVWSHDIGVSPIDSGNFVKRHSPIQPFLEQRCGEVRSAVPVFNYCVRIPNRFASFINKYMWIEIKCAPVI